MQATHQGLISTSLGRLVTIINFFEKRGFQTLFVVLTNNAIRDYKFYISPNKGFSCAHRKLHSSESCSEYFLSLVTSYGLSQAIPLFQQRLEDCRQANNILAMSASEEGLGEEAEIEVSAKDVQEEHPEEKTDKASENSSFVDWCGGYFNGCSCGDLAIPLWGPCDSNHNGVLDQGDCSGVDIPCDGIDIGGCDCNF